jgi:Spy/CpxP family protein refolding chaperone
MQIQHKIALILLAAAISLPVANAQDTGTGPGSDQPSGPEMHRYAPGGGWREHAERGPGRGHGCCGPARGMHGWGRRDFMLAQIMDDPSLRQRLGITAEQTAKIRQQTSAFRKTQIRNRADVEVKRVELRDLLSADQPDRVAIDKKLDEISASRLAQEKAAVDFRLSIRDVLTPDQRQKLEQMRHGVPEHGPGPRRGRPGGSGGPSAPPGPPPGN